MNSPLIRNTALGIFVVAILGGLGYWLVTERQRINDENRIEQQARNDNWITEQKQLLKSGEQNYVYFYSTFYTDDMIAEFYGMTEIEKLGFEMTDLSNDGVRHVAALPNLQELMLYGGIPNIGDAGMELLRENQTLRKLVLINVDVTDAGLAVLQSLPNLIEVVLHRVSPRATLTDAALKQLSELTNLEKLTISGSWMSQAAISELRIALPDCEIDVDSNGEDLKDIF